MNDQDKKILELYLKDVRKKKIIFLTIVVSKNIKKIQIMNKIILNQMLKKMFLMKIV